MDVKEVGANPADVRDILSMTFARKPIVEEDAGREPAADPASVAEDSKHSTEQTDLLDSVPAKQVTERKVDLSGTLDASALLAQSAEYKAAEDVLNKSIRSGAKQRASRREQYAEQGLLLGLDVPDEVSYVPRDDSEVNLALSRHHLIDLGRIMQLSDAQQRAKVAAPVASHPPGSRKKRTVSFGGSSKSRGTRKGSSTKKKTLSARKQEVTRKMALTTMTAGDLMENQRILRRMHNNLNFTKNPRFESSRLADTSSPSTAFKCTPAQVRFAAYAAGHRYNQTVTVRNTHHVGRRFILLPPKSPYFSVGPVKYPANKAVIAPGMSCTVEVFFAPDAVTDFEDVLVFQTDDGVLQLPLLGVRQRPVLSLPSTLECGVCRVGECVDVTFPCVNTGGLARCVVTNKATDYRTALASVNQDEECDVGCFVVSPAKIDLKTGQTCNVVVSLAPVAAETMQEDIVLVFDNDEVRHIKLTGEGAEVALRVTHVGDHELRVDTPLEVLRFADTPAGGRCTRQIVIENPNELTVPFDLDVTLSLVDEDNDVGSNTGDDDKDESKDSTSRSSGNVVRAPVLSVSPRGGVFRPLQAQEFTVTFNPSAVQSFAGSLTLSVGDTPGADVLDPERSRAFELTVQLFGRGVPCTMSVSPPLLYFGHPLAVDRQVNRHFRVTNHSASKATFTVQRHTGDSGVEVVVTPPSAELRAGMSTTVQLEMTPHRSGNVDFALPLVVTPGDVQLSLGVSAAVGVPRIEIVQPAHLAFGWLNFGVANVSKELSFVIQNTGTCPAAFLLCQDGFVPKPLWTGADLLADFADDTVNALGAAVTCHPFRGVLYPQEKLEVEAMFRPAAVGKLDTHIKCFVKDGGTKCIRTTGSVQSPRVVMDTLRVQLGDCYSNIPTTATVSVRNLRGLPAEVEWEDVVTEQFRAKFTPCRGVVAGNGTLSVQLEVTPLHPGPLNAVLGCDVNGLDLPLAFEVQAAVHGLVVSYHVPGKAPQQDPSRKSLEQSLLALDLPQAAWGRSPHSSQVLSQEEVHATQEQADKATARAREVSGLWDQLYPRPEPVVPQDQRVWGAVPGADFGRMEVGHRKVMWVAVRNHTAVSTSFKVSVDRLCPHVQSARTLAASVMQRVSQPATSSSISATTTAALSLPTGFRSGAVAQRLGKSRRRTRKGKSHSVRLHELTGAGQTLRTDTKAVTFRSKAGKAFNKHQNERVEDAQLLSGGTGCVFLLSQEKGVLPPWSSVEICVMAVADMCGEYQDNLVWEIGGLQPTLMPLHLTVDGSPLSFAASTPGLFAAEYSDSAVMDQVKDNFPVCVARDSALLSWPAVPAHDHVVQRLVTMQNTGPIDVQIRWVLHDTADARFDKLVQVKLAVQSCSADEADAKDQRAQFEVHSKISAYEPPKAGPSCPFRVEPAVVVVPARGSAQFTVSFMGDAVAADKYFAWLEPHLQVATPIKRLTAKERMQRRLRRRGSRDASRANKAMASSVRSGSDIGTSAQGMLDMINTFEQSLASGAPARRPTPPKTAQSTTGKASPAFSLLSMEEPVWGPAPAPMLRKAPVLRLVARAVTPMLVVDKREQPDGTRRLRFKADCNLVDSFLLERPTAVAATSSALARRGRVPEKAKPFVRTLPLLNPCDTPLRFTVSATPADTFRVVTQQPSLAVRKERKKSLPTMRTSKTADLAPSDKLNTLRPQEALGLGIEFVPPLPEQTDVWPLRVHHTLSGHVAIQFTNGTTQLCPLEALLSRPALRLSPSLHGFAKVNVSSSAQLKLRVDNPTTVLAHWEIVHVQRPHVEDAHRGRFGLMSFDEFQAFSDHEPSEDDASVFHFSTTSGELPRTSFPVLTTTASAPLHARGNEPLVIDVTFSPARAARYRCDFELRVRHGVPASIPFTLTGQGVFDEALSS